MRKTIFIWILALGGFAWAQYNGSGGGSGSGTTTDVSNVTTGILNPANGGTGVNNPGTSTVLIGEGTSPIHNISLTNFQVLLGQTGVDPAPVTLTPGSNIQISSTTTTLTISATAGGNPGGNVNSVQFQSNSTTFGGDNSFLIQPSSVGVYQPIQLSSNTTVGVDGGHCGALFNGGAVGGTRCSQAGNNMTSNNFVWRWAGGGCAGFTDTSDSLEANLCVDATGMRVGPNISAEANQFQYSTFLTGYRLGGTGISTFGKNLGSADAGSNAQVYIVGASTAAVPGTIYASMASTNTAANTNEIGLYETALNAFQFKNSGDCLEIFCGAAGAATATTKQLRIRFNNTTLSSVNGTAIADTGAVTANNADLDVSVKICKNGSNTQVVLWSDNQVAGTIGVLPAPPAPAATDTAAINVSCTCQNGTANSADCVGKGMTIEYKPAP